MISIDTPLSKITRIFEPEAKALKKLGIETVGDLLYHFPVRYGDTSDAKNIAGLARGETAVVFGRVTKLKTSKGFRSKIPMASAEVEDESGKIQCVWFNQPYIAKMIPEGAYVRIEGKVSQRKVKSPDEIGAFYFSNPKIEPIEKMPIGVGDSLFGEDGEAHTLYPIYPESRGVTSNWMYHALQKTFKSGVLDTIDDPLPKEMLEKYSLPTLRTALIWIHTPMKNDQAEVARKRFAFEEIFFIQLEKQAARRDYEKNPSFSIEMGTENDANRSVTEFVKRFPFPATDAQTRAIDAIVGDMKKGKAMARLLEGDVGSGKTAVAAAAAYAVVTARTTNGNLQVAYMCPTEILATQHFESFISYFAYLGIQIGLITGNGCRKFPSKINPKGWTDISRSQLLSWVANGEIHILIGTHALIQKSVKFKKLALAIIDEQHRFGTNQRAELIRKEAAEKIGKTLGSRNVETKTRTKTPVPHLLSMTATPIPRTLALTVYGDLDLTLLDQMPSGRKPIITEIVTSNHREQTYEKIRAEIAAGRQAYVICPRIDEPDPTKEAAVNAKSVKEEATRLKHRIFPEYTIDILHSKMKPAEKESVMLDFKAGKIDILCATSVVEVGVNVPNATIIVIEGGERFGLAQLHQLRGRVIRSIHQAYCYVFTGNGSSSYQASDKTIERLRALTTAHNGFELAEYDLQLRGAGALSGGKQWGMTDLAMEALKNIKMVEAARTEAARLLDTDPSFAQFPFIKTELTRRQTSATHFE
jgi:ATP-dependent DNA helicase RecG